MPSTDSNNSAAVSTSSASSERLPSLSSISICAARTPNCTLQSDKKKGSLEACAAPNTAELTPVPAADAYVPNSGSDCNREPTAPTGTPAFGVDGCAGNVPESAIRQELLQSTDEPVSHSEAADRNLTSESTDSKDEGKQSDFDPVRNSKEEPEGLDGDEKDRCELEQIMDHDVHDGWKRYGVKMRGFAEERLTWVPESYFFRRPEVIQKYWDGVGNQNSAGDPTELEARSHRSSDLALGSRASLLDYIARISNQLAQTPLRPQHPLAA